ncbi:RYR3 protein, partial [Urocynchramus pylzowi]|nr:RYR3 protein [Urocynchramus pylzowi]
TLKELISQTMVRWSQEDQIQDPELVRIMYSLLRRQYDSIGELLQALRKAYTISAASVKDTINLLAALGQIRSLLSVRMGKEEELLMINGLGYGINGILVLSWCEAFCYLSKYCNFFFEYVVLRNAHSVCGVSRLYVPQTGLLNFVTHFNCKNHNVLAAIYYLWPGFCNKAAPICTHLGSLRSFASYKTLVPANVTVVTYLAGCGLQSCPVLLAKGYPDIGWNPIEGERYLSFLRFAVFANSESVEENASVVVKLLIR